MQIGNKNMQEPSDMSCYFTTQFLISFGVCSRDQTVDSTSCTVAVAEPMSSGQPGGLRGPIQELSCPGGLGEECPGEAVVAGG